MYVLYVCLEFQRGVAHDVNVSQPSVSNTVKFAVQKIVDKAHTWIHFPHGNDELIAAMEEWQQKYIFPTVIGALDCTQIEIKKIHLGLHGHEYICRKGFASINVQATCNANEIFTSVCAECPGSVHYRRIWKSSSICQLLRESLLILFC
ncbi:DDE Tnp 4 domain containing protein [Asbolus verrucosus]|uniref:DDE Tnp 4 domain containing protein n=1 Tax=Asbolus verrucosus TaxID=1661398 RepID=A0A482WDL0_ASBVE|nr:DDE Tnp 4 domain containing protein [Asbolus verrucosus]